VVPLGFDRRQGGVRHAGGRNPVRAGGQDRPDAAHRHLRLRGGAGLPDLLARRDDKFLRDLATVWFVRQCREAGYWDASRPVRSLGVWPGEDGQVVLHVGDELWRLIAEGKKPETLPIIEALRERKRAALPPAPPGPPAGEGRQVRGRPMGARPAGPVALRGDRREG
jgi:hypothetical protein